jgi:uncharacterized membrane protein YfcA
MPPELVLLLTLGVFAIAVLYSCVGHAGASGYIAWMSLLGLAPAVIRPSALALNILVASIATWQFVRAGHFHGRLFWPFVALSIPAAFVGGYITLPTTTFKVLLGFALLWSAAHFAFTSSRQPGVASAPPLWAALAAGAAIGLLSGLTGTGGGIFLTPMLLLLGWAAPKQAAAVSAPFVLLNSIAGILGNLSATPDLPPALLVLLVAAGAGGLLGSRMGSTRLPAAAIKRLLAGVLVIAGLKLLFT